MKIRNGFVSNSSSSSFVFLFPENFKLDLSSVDFSEIEDATEESIQKAFCTLLREKVIWEEEYYEEVTALLYVLSDYIIASSDTTSSGGQFVIADKKKVIRILNED